jgi:hypothetical protein
MRKGFLLDERRVQSRDIYKRKSFLIYDFATGYFQIFLSFFNYVLSSSAVH